MMNVHNLSDSDADEPATTLSKRKRHASTDTDDTLDPDDDLELFRARTMKAKAKKATHSPTKSSEIKHQTSIHMISDSEDDEAPSTVTRPAVVKNRPVVSRYDHKLDRIKTSLKSSDSTVSISSSQNHELSDSADSDCTVDLSDCSPTKSGTPRKSSTCTSRTPGEHSSGDSRPLCRYGDQCYRKNPSHLKEFKHSVSDTSLISGPSSFTDDPKPSGSKPSAQKSLRRKSSEKKPPSKKQRSETGNNKPPHKKQCSETEEDSRSHGQKAVHDAGDLGFLLSRVIGIHNRFNNRLALDIKDILSSSMGCLQKSAQFNYMTDIAWLISQYPPEYRKKPLLIVHGCQRREKAALEKEALPYTNISLCQAKLDIPYGTHHTKMMFLEYTDGMRIVITTANLIQQDWAQKTQGIWMSPVFARLPEGSSSGGDSETYFKRDLLQYLSAYRTKGLEEWCTIIKQHDMSTAKVYLIGSVPGRHTGILKSNYGHLKLRQVLQKEGPSKLLVQNWPLVGQFSSVGSLGAKNDSWVCSEWLESMSSAKSSIMSGRAKLQLVYPSVDNVRMSLEGYPAGASLPYSINTAQKQTWFPQYLCQWKSTVRGRCRAMPHIKSYMRLSPDGRNLAWFILTSANLSKAAWGVFEKDKSQLMIRSYELGVLFLPQQFGNKSSFSVMRNIYDPAKNEQSGQLTFPLPYDVPVSQYQPQDRPWIWDIPHVQKPDSHGNKWCPT